MKEHHTQTKLMEENLEFILFVMNRMSVKFY